MQVKKKLYGSIILIYSYIQRIDKFLIFSLKGLRICYCCSYSDRNHLVRYMGF